MSVESPPTFLQAGTYGAEQTRRAIGMFLQRGASIGSVAGGIVAAGDCALSPPGSGLSVNVAPGEVIIPGSSSASQSGYGCRVTSTTNLPIAAADPSNPRIDRVSGIVADAAYAGGVNSFSLAVETGTPSAGANLTNLTGAAAAPTSSYTLGYVLVPAAATNIVGGDLLGVATQALIGLGLNLPTAASKGSANIVTSQSTSSTSYTTLATPDQVTGVVLPTNGLIAVWYQAVWQESSNGAARAAIFLGGNQVEIQNNATPGPATQAATTGSNTPNINLPLVTFDGGLTSPQLSTSGVANDVTTGQIVGVRGASGLAEEVGGSIVSVGASSTGGACYIFAAAGTYTVSVQFKASSGSVTASNRKLWVQEIF